MKTMSVREGQQQARIEQPGPRDIEIIHNAIYKARLTRKAFLVRRAGTTTSEWCCAEDSEYTGRWYWQYEGPGLWRGLSGQDGWHRSPIEGYVKLDDHYSIGGMGFSIIGASGSGELRKSLRLGGAKRRDLDWYIPETGVVGAQRMIREAIAIAAPAHEAALVAREQAVIEEERTSLMRALASAKADAVAGPTGHEVRVIHHDPVDGEGNLASEGGYLSAWDETVPVPAWAAQADRDERVQQLQNALDKLPSK